MKHSRYARASMPMAHGGMVKDSMIEDIIKNFKKTEVHEEMEYDKTKESDLDYEMDGPHEPFHDIDDIDEIEQARKLLKKMLG